MKVLMILDKEFPPDERVEKEAISLIKAGFEVLLVCLTFCKRERFEAYKNIQIVRININKTLRNKLFGLFLIFPFYKLFWKNKIINIIKEYNIKILHVHDLPLADVGVKLKNKYNLKLVCDQHEYFSNWIVNTATYNTFLGKIIKYFSNWEKYEKSYLPLADLIITVEEPLRQCYINEVKILPEKIITVPNTPNKEIFNTNNIDQRIINKYKNKYIIFYAGGIDTLRGIDVILGSLKSLKSEIPNLKFVIAGTIYKGYDLIKNARKFGVEDLIDFVGWVPLEKLPSYIFSSDICVFTPPSTWKEINQTVATKIYQYIAMGKPVIVSQAKMMKEFVLENKIGFAIKDMDSTDFTKKVLELYLNKQLSNTFIENSKKMSRKYFWDETVDILIQRYKSFKINEDNS
jgi:glycosyltransferase involved in cell wall biosynthesis